MELSVACKIAANLPVSYVEKRFPDPLKRIMQRFRFSDLVCGGGSRRYKGIKSCPHGVNYYKSHTVLVDKKWAKWKRSEGATMD